MDFPTGQFDFDALTTPNLFETIHRIINVKIHLHHSHVTGKIFGYAHGFCNMKVRENENQFSCITHNLFNMFFFLFRGIRILVWGTKDLNIDGSGLTKINFASVGSQVKFNNTLKYYLSSLGSLASILEDVEKMLIGKLTLQFLN